MTNFIEVSEFSEAVPMVNLDIGNYDANKQINTAFQKLVNRTRFLKEQNTGGGFAYGGELDATPQQVIQVAAFTDLDNCTVVNGLFTTTGVGVAMARNIVQADLTDANIRFTWPDTASGGVFMIGFGTPNGSTFAQFLNGNLDTSFAGLYGDGNYHQAMAKFGDNNPTPQGLVDVAIGDSVLLNFDYATHEIRAYNETQEQALMSVDVSSFATSSPFALFIYGNTPIEFDIEGTDSPAVQVTTQIILPKDANGKTYLVTAATENSIVDGKLLKTNDFVTFYEDEGLKCVVNRLLSDADIQAIVDTALNAPNITRQTINAEDNGGTGYTLENANEFRIDLTGEYAPSASASFVVDNSCFNQGRLVRIHVVAQTDVDLVGIAYFGGTINLDNIMTGTEWVFVLEQRGEYVELISKYQV